MNEISVGETMVSRNCDAMHAPLFTLQARFLLLLQKRRVRWSSQEGRLSPSTQGRRAGQGLLKLFLADDTDAAFRR
jgi:hypothetical protein